MITLKSPAKINLFLNIVEKRKDSYHNIETYFQLINLYDQISFKLIPGSKIKFFSNNSKLSNIDNLCIDAAEILRNYMRKENSLNVSIDLQKNIPIGGGLGGGSSNAASILLGLNNLWKCNLPINELSALGKKLGSDVPVFINGYSAFGKSDFYQEKTVAFAYKFNISSAADKCSKSLKCQINELADIP